MSDKAQVSSSNRPAERSWWRTSLGAAMITLAGIALVVVGTHLVVTLQQREKELQLARQGQEAARQLLENEEKERQALLGKVKEKEREIIRESLMREALALRHAGKRAEALRSLGEAARIRSDDILRCEAIETITQNEFRFLGQGEEFASKFRTISGSNAFVLPGGLMISPNRRFLILDNPATKEVFIRVWDLVREKFVNRLGSPALKRDQRFGMSFSADGNLLAIVAVQSEDEPDDDQPRFGGVQHVVSVWDLETAMELGRVPEARSCQWVVDRPILVVERLASPSCWEVIRPIPTYRLHRPIQSLSLNRDGTRLAVGTEDPAPFFVGLVSRGYVPPRPTSSYLFAVVQQHQRLELALTRVGPGIVPQFLRKDELWTRWGDIDRYLWLKSQENEPRKAFPPLPQGGWELVRWEGWKDLRKKLDNHLTVVGTGHWQLTPQQRGPLLLPALSQPELAQKRSREIRGWARFASKPERLAFSPTEPLLFRICGLWYYHFDLVPLGWIGASGAGYCLELWNYEESKLLAVWSDRGPLEGGWNCCQFTPDGKRVLVGSKRGLEVWNVATGKVEKTLSSQPVDELTLSPDGRRVLVIENPRQEGSRFNPGKASLLAVETGEGVRTWQISRGAWRAFALNQDGTRIVAGDADGMIHLWNAGVREELAYWPGHNSPVTALLFSRDGHTLYSGSEDGTVKLWSLPLIRKELQALNLDWRD